jgi:hypothetical protein
MSTIQKKVIIAGIKIKLARGEDLESILAMYVNLTNEEKQEVRDSLGVL